MIFSAFCSKLCFFYDNDPYWKRKNASSFILFFYVLKQRLSGGMTVLWNYQNGCSDWQHFFFKLANANERVVFQSILHLMLFHLSSVVFYCETEAQVSVATLWNNWFVQNKFNVRPALTKYKNRTILKSSYSYSWTCSLSYANASGRHMHSRKLHLCLVSALFLSRSYDW